MPGLDPSQKPKNPKISIPPLFTTKPRFEPKQQPRKNIFKTKFKDENRLAIGNRGYLHLDGSYLSENPVIVVIVTVVFVSGNVSEQLALLD